MDNGPPNRLFISYLEKLQAKCLQRGDRRSVGVYEKALESLRKYPVPLRSAKEAQKLSNIGPRVVADLERCFEKYARVSPTKMALLNRSKQAKRTTSATDSVVEIVDAVPEPAKRQKTHAPPPPSAAVVQPKPQAAVAVAVPRRLPSINDTVMLVVDFRELKKHRGAQLRSVLEGLGVPLMEASLSLSDMLWVVRPVDGIGGELVMKHGVERKTVMDLSESIKDGRYYEQKGRLKQSGLTNVVYLIEGPLTVRHKPHSYGEPKSFKRTEWGTLPPETLEAAIASSAYGSSDFIVQRTKDIDATALWLARYTARLQGLVRAGLAAPHCFDCNLEHFNSVNRKDTNLTVSEIFARQLICVPGVSTKKVSGIVQAYPTMAALAEAYHAIGDDDRAASKKMLAKVALPGGGRTLGPVASEAIARAITRDD